MSESDASMKEIFRLQAAVCKTLSHSTRLIIVHQLRTGEKSVGQLVSSLGLPQGNVSRHLSALRTRGIVSSRRDGTMVYYGLTSPSIGEACDLVRRFLESYLTRNYKLPASIDGSARGHTRTKEEGGNGLE